MEIYLRWSLKSRIHSDLWHVSIVDVFVAVPHAVDQISLFEHHQQKKIILKEYFRLLISNQAHVWLGVRRKIQKIKTYIYMTGKSENLYTEH